MRKYELTVQEKTDKEAFKTLMRRSKENIMLHGEYAPGRSLRDMMIEGHRKQLLRGEWQGDKEVDKL
jgi:hypothetical protein